ncbi:MAG: 1-acyl-sn-glycerol-3-phosphate acyltransferase, partial [Anaerolineales bacterium]|nr:1-acyl-sn-glycerol-3-phosphate acyltransferase [Anaerolineales bacterium]
MPPQVVAPMPLGYTRDPLGWYVHARWMFQVFVRLLFRMRVVGRANIPAGNYIVVANHLSWIDPFLLVAVLPARPRLYFIGARQAVNRDWKARLVQKFDMLIPFERGASWVGKDVFAKPLQVLAAGAVLGLFPEGNLGPTEGALQPLRSGIGHIALRAQCLILPVALCGVRELYLGKPITLFIGKPFRVQVEGLARREALNAAVDQVAGALRAILPPYVEPQPRFKPM